MIIGLHGADHTGKHTLAQVLVEDFGYSHIRFGFTAESMLYQMNPMIHAGLAIEGGVGIMRLRSLVDQMGWARAKSDYEEITRLLDQTTKATRDCIGPDAVIESVLQNYTPSQKYIITDLNYPNEFDAVILRRGVLVNITRPGVADHSHDVVFDFTLTNDGTIAQWQDQALALVKDAADLVTRRSTEISPQGGFTSHFGMR